MQKKFVIKNKVLIIFLLMFFGILPSLFIKVNSFIHQSDYLEISNLEDAIYNDCIMTSEGIEIYGPDPYMILSGFDVNLKSVQLVLNAKSDLRDVQIFYDEGNGFCEQNSARSAVHHSGVIVGIDSQYRIKTIRVDFETISDCNIIDLQAVRLNSNWALQFDNNVLIGATLIIILSLFISWATMKFKAVSKQELISFAIGEIEAMLSCYALMWILESKYIFLYGCIVICLTVLLNQLICFENEKKLLLSFALFVFLTLLFWICTIPYNGAPDEAMRYDIVNYIVQYNRIPLGEEIEIRNKLYGFSYAFAPINVYILDSFFVKLASFFTTNINILIVVARIPNVLLAIGTVAFTYGIACEKLSGRVKWVFLCGVMLLPEMIFIYSYVNCDGIAVFCFAWIVYYMIKAEKKKWALKECLILGLGIGICLLSYYNSYGVILTTVIYCVVSVLNDKSIGNKLQFLLQRTIWVFIPAFLYAGWWFIRGAIHHNGDFLGIVTSNKYGELYGFGGYKPSQRVTPNSMGVSLQYMLCDMRWLYFSSMSFVAVFGYLNIFMPYSFYQVYYRSIIVAILIALVRFLYHLILKKDKKINIEMRLSKFSFYLMANMIITISLAVFSSYFIDFQAQGRYYILAVFPIMYFVAKCLEYDTENQPPNVLSINIMKSVQICISIFFIAIFVYAFIFGIIQSYF